MGEKERIREGEGEKETERDGNSVELYSASNNIGTSGKEPACQCRDMGLTRQGRCHMLRDS